MAITGLGDSPFSSTWIKTKTLYKSIYFGGDTSALPLAMNDWFFVSVTPSTGALKYWDGASWVSKSMKRWDGASWVSATLKRWDGASWITV